MVGTIAINYNNESTAVTAEHRTPHNNRIGASVHSTDVTWIHMYIIVLSVITWCSLAVSKQANILVNVLLGVIWEEEP